MRYFICILALCVALCSSANAAPINKVVAVVNGDMITEFDLNRMLAPVLLRAGINPKDKKHQDTINRLKHELLQTQIRDLIVAQEAERMHISASDEEVDVEIKRIRENAGLTEEQFMKQLKAQKFTLEEFRSNIRKSILSQNLLSHMVARKVVITREEIERYYNAHPEMFSKGYSVHLAMIVYGTANDAEKWASKVKSGKISFEDAVKKVSVGDKTAGGDIGDINFSDMSSALQEQVSKLKVGEVSDAFEINSMNVQVRLLSTTRDESEKQSIDEAAPQIEAMLREPRLKERFNEYLDLLTKRAVVDIRL